MLAEKRNQELPTCLEITGNLTSLIGMWSHSGQTTFS